MCVSVDIIVAHHCVDICLIFLFFPLPSYAAFCLLFLLASSSHRRVFFLSFLSFEWKWAAILVGKSACDDYIFRQTMQFQIFCKLSLSFIIIQPFRADGCRHNCRQECVSSKGSISLFLSRATMFTSGKVLIAEIRISTTHYPATVPFFAVILNCVSFLFFLKYVRIWFSFRFFLSLLSGSLVCYFTSVLARFMLAPSFIVATFFSTVYFHSHRLNLSGKWNVEIQVPILQQRVSLILLHFTWVERFVKVGC